MMFEFFGLESFLALISSLFDYRFAFVCFSNLLSIWSMFTICAEIFINIAIIYSDLRNLMFTFCLWHFDRLVQYWYIILILKVFRGMMLFYMPVYHVNIWKELVSNISHLCLLVLMVKFHMHRFILYVEKYFTAVFSY